MITKVTIKNFKRFKDETEFHLKPHSVTFLAGGNNSGKSTLLHALAVWEFARSAIEITKGKAALLANSAGQSVGVGAEEFSPISLPDLKHLFSDLGSRRLSIRCQWSAQSEAAEPRFLTMSAYLANDRLYLKPSESNLQHNDHVPRLAYLPPFAGMTAREERMSPAKRKRLVGQGLAGGILRNLLYDFWHNRGAELERLKNTKGKITKSAKGEFRKSDPWEQLSLTLAEVFRMGLGVKPYNELYHSTIKIVAWEGQFADKKFSRKKKAALKDLMVEGSGFLQWLSVYALALDRDLNVLMLDEPDAHLHPALQGHMIHKLGQLARENGKQVLMATHSTTILGESHLDRIYRMEDRAYLNDEQARVKLFVGLGSQYAPRLDQLKRCKRLFLHDGPTDLEVLMAWAKTLGLTWPVNLVPWKYTKDRSAREVLFDELRAEIPDLKAISLQDRDDAPYKESTAELTVDKLPLWRKGLGLRRWRRRNLESHLLCPAAISRASGTPEQMIVELLSEAHGLVIPPDFAKSDCGQTLMLIDGKDVFLRHTRSIANEFKVNQLMVAEKMLPDEIPEDGKMIVQQIVEFCQQ